MIGVDDTLLKLSEVTSLLRLDDSQNRFVNRQIKNGSLRVIVLSHHDKRVSRVDLARFLSERTTKERQKPGRKARNE